MRTEKMNIGKNYRFLIILVCSMIFGTIFGYFKPDLAKEISFLGTVFINMMFCIVVPLVFASISGAIACMENRNRAGNILVTTVITFIITGVIASIIMFLLMKAFPPVLTPWETIETEVMGEHATIRDMIVNFFTANDFTGLLTRRAMLPLVVFSILFGFSVNMASGPNGIVANMLKEVTLCMLKFVNIITYYTPIAFFAIFAGLMADYGHMITVAYGRAMLVYYPLCFIYIFTAFPIFAYIGGGKDAVKEMFRHILPPIIVSLGTCSSVATIPTNLDASEKTGIPKDVAKMVMPLGATMHMDGSCFASVLKIAFVLGVFGQPLDWKLLVPIILVAVVSAVGMSGVPGGGYIGEYIVCVLFFPDKIEMAFPILVAIGTLVDPPATMINAAGDYVVSFIVARFVDGKNWFKNRMLEVNIAKAKRSVRAVKENVVKTAKKIKRKKRAI